MKRGGDEARSKSDGRSCHRYKKKVKVKKKKNKPKDEVKEGSNIDGFVVVLEKS